MMKTKTTKRALLTSALSLLLCISMLVGSTFAWFTDNVSSKNNIIKSGNLDITLEYAVLNPDGTVKEWKDVKDASDILTGDRWEPGYVDVAYLRLKNAGSLALKYALDVNIVSEKAGVNKDGDTFLLSDYIYFDVIEDKEPAYATREAALAETTETTKISAGYAKQGSLEAGSDYVYLAMIVYMPTTVDNKANHDGKTVPQIDLGVSVFATQYTSEEDTFNKYYDKGAAWTGGISQPEQDENGVFQIGSAEELAWFAQYVNGTLPTTFGARAAAPQGHNAVLTADINLNNLPWTPIGRTLTAEESAAGHHAFDFQFRGKSNVAGYAVFDGQGHTVYNLNVKEAANAGLFGAAVYAVIKNVNVTGAKVVSNHFAGAVLAQGYARVENCDVTDATVICTPEKLANGDWDNGDKVGGVVGKISEGGEGSVYGAVNCSATDVKVTGYRDVGGILGFAGNYANVTGNKVTNVTLTQDATHDYKAFDQQSKYNINAIVGDSTRSPGVKVSDNSGEAKIVPMVNSSAALKDSAAEKGATVSVNAGTYTFPSKVAEGVTLVCEEGTVFEGTSGLNINCATVEGATFRNDGGVAVSGTINGTFKDCVFEGEEALRWCYSKAGETIVFENCVIKTDFRGFHFDDMAGNVIFRNCEINGFNAYGGTGKMTFENCKFGNDQSRYNGLNIYADTEIIGGNFKFVSGKTNFIDMEGTGKTLSITNCTATLDGKAASVMSFVGGSKLAQNNVVVNGATVTKKDGLYTDASGNYYIFDAAELSKLNQYFTDGAYGHAIWGKTYNIMADIDASDVTWKSVKLNTPNNDCVGFTWNGNGHTISGLTITGSGMFSSTTNGKNTDVPATFKNLTFDKVTVSGGYHTGVIWAQMYGDIVLENVHIKNSEITGTCNVGAFVGRNGDQGASTIAFKKCSVTNTKITAKGNGDPNGASAFLGSALTITNSVSTKVTFENCSQSGNTLTSASGQVGGGIYAWWNASTNDTGVVNDFTAY